MSKDHRLCFIGGAASLALAGNWRVWRFKRIAYATAIELEISPTLVLLKVSSRNCNSQSSITESYTIHLFFTVVQLFQIRALRQL